MFMTTIKTQPYLGQPIAATVIDYFVIFAFSVVFVTTLGVRGEEGSISVDGALALMPELF
jgi:hypothetical protein